MVVHLDRRDVEGAAEVGNDTQVLIKPEKEEEESIEKKNGTSSFLRVFTFGNPRLYVLECIAFVAAIMLGVAVAMVNLIMGNFLTLLSDFSFSDAISMPGDFIAAVRTSA